MGSPARQLAAAVGGAALTSVLYAAAYPPYRFNLFAWVALVPFLLVVRRVRWPAALVAAVVFPVIACALTISWMPRAAATYYAQPFAVGIATFLAIALLMVAPYVVGFTLLYRFAVRRDNALAPLVGGALWVLGEYARSHVLTGNPFVLLGYSQAGSALRQVSDFSGVYGVSFLVAATNVAIANARWQWRMPASVGFALTFWLVAAAGVYSVWRIADWEADADATPVLIVQGNLDLGSQWRDELYGQNLDVYLRLTLDGMKERKPELVVWPENAMTFFIAREPLYRLSIAGVLARGPVQLLAGGPHFIEEDDRYLNSAYLLEPGGESVARYDKEKLLPFAEYFPLPQLDALRRSFGRVREFTAGEPSAPLPTVAGKAGILICNEAMFPGIASQRVHDGAEILVNLANDSWIADDQYAELAYDMAIFRAVEQRRYLIRASTSGPSAIIDPVGRTRGRTMPDTRAALPGAVGRETESTVYARYGDVFVLACALLVAAATVLRAASARLTSL